MSSTTKVVTPVVTGHLSTPEFSFSDIDLLPTFLATGTEQIDVYYKDKDDTVNQLLTDTVDYTIDSTTKVVTIITGTRPIVVNDVITIERDTRLSSRYTDFAGLAFLDADRVDADSDNLLHLCQELATDVGNALIKTVDESAWEGEGLELTNIAPATSSQSAPNLAQVQNLISGTDTAEVGEVHEYTATGDGSTTKYILTDFPRGDTSDAKLWTTLDGLTQAPTTDYAYAYVVADGDPSITFTSAPPSGVKINVRAISGSVQAVIANDSINGTAIVDGTVDIAALDIDSGDADRFILISAAGVPSVTQVATTNIQGFSAAVQSEALSDMSPPTASINMNSQKLTGLVAGTASTDSITKGQLDVAVADIVADATAAALAVVPAGHSVTGSLTMESGDPDVAVTTTNVIIAAYIWLDGDTSVGGHIDLNGSSTLSLGGNGDVDIVFGGGGVTFERSGGSSNPTDTFSYAILTV